MEKRLIARRRDLFQKNGVHKKVRLPPELSNMKISQLETKKGHPGKYHLFPPSAQGAEKDRNLPRDPEFGRILPE